MKFTIERFLDTIRLFPEAFRFIRKNRIWEGFWKYTWVSTLVIIIGLLFTVRFYSYFAIWWIHIDPAAIGTETRNLLSRFTGEGANLFLSSGFKYVIFIFMEIVIFHSVGRTIQLISKKQDREPTFKIFLKAQIRMIKISLRSWVKELIATILISIAIGISGADFLKTPLIFIVQCYYIGFMMVDNYNERLGMNITQSAKFTQKFADVTLAIGLVVYIIMYIPLIGTFVGPLLGGVTATLMMHRLIQPPTNEDYNYEM